MIWNSVIIVLVLGCLAAALTMRRQAVELLPDLASFYETLGLNVNLRGLNIDNIRTVQELKGGVPTLVIEGDIRNVSGQTVEVPYIRFSLRGRSSEEIYAWSIAPQAKNLPAGEWLNFKTSVPTPPSDAVDVEVRFVDEQNG